MVGGMGGLSNDFMSLVEDENKRDMMDSNQILGNMEARGQLMAPSMQQNAITHGGGQKAIGGLSNQMGQLSIQGGNGQHQQ